VDIQKAKQDTLCYKEIIKILLEEQFITRQQQMETDEYRGEDELFHPLSRGTSAKVAPRTEPRQNNLIQVIPIANKFEILANMNDSNETEYPTNVWTASNITSRKHKTKDQKMTQRSLQKSHGNNNLGRRRQRVLLLGDNHARKCASDLQHNLGHHFEVTSFVKPGATMEEIVSSSSESVKSLNRKDVLIVWGGSNDISRNNTKEAIDQLCNFIKEETTVNRVIMKAPLRHDLMPSSCVNNEVLKFNRQIEKRMKPYANTKLFDTDLDRSYYTTHGQHLNSSGKDLIINKLAILIKNVLVEKQPNPIQLPWKELIDEINQNQRTSDNLILNIKTPKHSPQFNMGKIEAIDQKNLMEPTTLLNLPKRQRKQIAQKNTDFLWT
jgi:hypothetical protein